jgi:hypothetical protein
MTAIACEYLDDYDRRSPPRGIPPELALLIVRKAERMAARFEDQALDEMTRRARSALRDGCDPRVIARQMGL